MSLLISHVVLCAALAAAAWLTCRCVGGMTARVKHCLWLIVLVRLMLPPLVYWPWSVATSFSGAVEHTRNDDSSRRSITATESHSEVTDVQFVSAETAVNKSHGVSSTLPLDATPALQNSLAVASRPTDTTLPRWSGVEIATLILLFVWLVGVGVQSLRFARRCRRIRAAINTGSQPSAAFQQVVANSAKQLGVRPPSVVVTPEVTTPCLWCFGRPVLLWPEQLTAGSSASIMSAVVTHELAHLRRRDHWVAWLTIIAQHIWWWNPTAAFVIRRLRDAAEAASDAIVVQVFPECRRQYAETLLAFSSNSTNSLPALAAVDFDAARRTAFQQRLESIMHDVPANHLSLKTITLLIVSGLLAVPAIAFSEGAPDETPEQPSASQIATPDKTKSSDEDESGVLISVEATAVDVQGKDNGSEQDKSNTFAPTASIPHNVSVEEVIDTIQRGYYREVDKEKLQAAAIAAVLKELRDADDSVQLLSPAEIKELMISTEGSLQGIGVVLAMDEATKMPVARETLARSPAYAAGVRSGDIISMIQGQSTKDMPLVEVVKLLRGKSGSDVHLQVLRGDSKTAFKVTRGTITIAQVIPWQRAEDGTPNYWIDPKKKIGYLHLAAFSATSAKEVTETVQKLAEENATALIFDLRGNAGGAFGAAIDIASLFLDRQLIVSTMAREDGSSTTFKSEPGHLAEGMTLVLLVDRRTASAAELFTAAMQDHGRGTVVGEQTFGRGVIQKIVNLKGGSALKMVTAEWFRPNGDCIHRYNDSDTYGVKPDAGHAIELSEAQRAAADVTIQKRRDADLADVSGDDAVLKHALSILR